MTFHTAAPMTKCSLVTATTVNHSTEHFLHMITSTCGGGACRKGGTVFPLRGPSSD